MNMYEYKGRMYSANELSEMSGIAVATIRSRLRKGYSVSEAVQLTPTNESVLEFNDASWWEDWLGMSTSYLHEIYWKWCVSNGYTPLSKIPFVREIMRMYPQLKTVPTRKDNECCRIIRLK